MKHRRRNRQIFSKEDRECRNTEEKRRGGGESQEETLEGTGIHTHVHQRKLGNNPLARDQRFHVTRKDHLNSEALTIQVEQLESHET